MPNEPTIKSRRLLRDVTIDESFGSEVASIIFKMIFAVAALFVLLRAVQGGVVPAPSIVSAPARFVASPIAAPLIAPAPAPVVAAAPAPIVAAAPAPVVAAAPARFVAAAPAPIVAAAPAPVVAAAPAPLAAYAKAVPQSVAPFAASVNYVARSPLLPYTVGGPVVSPVVETFSAPLVARRFGPVAAPLVAGPAPFVGAVF